jgi:hypothetical protein
MAKLAKGPITPNLKLVWCVFRIQALYATDN